MPKIGQFKGFNISHGPDPLALGWGREGRRLYERPWERSCAGASRDTITNLLPLCLPYNSTMRNQEPKAKKQQKT